jgi:serine/threonine-protein kinase RsbW
VPKKSEKIYNLTIPSRIDSIAKVETLTEKIAKKMKFNKEDRDNLSIAVTETVNNAVIHGNKENPDKKVQISFEIEKNKLIIKVKDEGKSFDLSKLKNPLAPENLLKENGRGVFIVKSLMDKVDYNFTDSGTEVIMIKIKR